MSAEVTRMRERLDYYYRIVKSIILSRQNPCTGLIPASVAVTSHGDYRDAWVRDNVNSIMAVFGLSLAYRRLDDDSGRAYELEHAVVKCMRGLLFAMMRQAPKVEKFKNTQHILDSLHAKYNTGTGDTVVLDDQWGHLQLDATSIFMLSLAQMTASGLQIIFTQDEVDFVQNLVYYIERAYRTPDYGVWERGNKVNHGQPELNSSSIGMVTAALQAINGLNLFGPRGGFSSIIHCLPDEISRNFIILHNALPRESNSKEIDAALLSVIGFPAFAVQDPKLIERTRNEIINKLGGNYGCKRFLRDGHQTVLEDTSRLHYDPAELLIFEGIECEWPLFFTYLILDGIFFGDKKRAEHYIAAIKPCLITAGDLVRFHPNQAQSVQGLDEDVPLVPEIFLVPKEVVAEEKAQPRSQQRLPNENVPLVWAESLYVLGQLLHEDLLSVSDVDPLGRRLLPFYRMHRNVDTVVQMVLLCENSVLQDKLAMYGLETQTLEQVAPITISPPNALREAFSYLGANQKLGLSGRPRRPIGTLSTSKIYRIQGQLHAFTPHFMSIEEFYLTSDNNYLMSLFENELSFVRNNWYGVGRPTMFVLLTSRMLTGLGHNTYLGFPNGRRPSTPSSTFRTHGNILSFFMSLRAGTCGQVRVKLGRLSELLNTCCVESLEFLGDRYSEWSQNLPAHKGVQSTKLQLSEIKTKKAQSSHSRRGTLKGVASSTHSLTSPTNKKSFDFLSTSQAPSPTDNDNSYLGGHKNNTSDTLSEDHFKLKEHNHLHNRSNSFLTSEATDDHKTPKSDERCIPINCRLSEAREVNQLSLTLGDSSAVPMAIETLQASENLFDQVDLLHYIYSCHGLSYHIEALHSTVEELLKEMYEKALELQMWSIVRQTAGMLRKVVNSLAINLTDLLIRQKQLTIGTYTYDTKGKTISTEVTISSPLTPDALMKLIYKHSSSDIREPPLIQELLTTLGTLIRGDSSPFKGIIRFRMYSIVLALREEISRIRNCDEEDAIEHLMEMSPFEITCLCDSTFNNKPASFVHFERSTVGSLLPATSTQPLSLRKLLDLKEQDIPKLDIRAQAAGFHAGNFASVEINGISLQLNGRGLNVVVLDTINGEIVESVHFDTHFSTAESDEFAELIEWIEPGTIIVVVAKDEFVENLTEMAIKACEKIGSKHIRSCKYRDSWAIIGVKGNTQESVFESYRGAQDGPTEVLNRTLDLDAAHTTQDGAPTPMPSHGRCYRKRKNDGALNRVPFEFYARVWFVLDRSEGITVHNRTLPRHPTVLEKTPGEFNFAIQVEATLDAITDATERQIAVECLMIIHRLMQINSSVKVNNNIDIMALVTKAVVMYWDKWSVRTLTTAHTPASQTSRSKSPTPLSFEKNQQLARHTFADLPADGEESTTGYILQSIIAEYPDFLFSLAVQDYDSCDIV